jgi:hypothetical protein
MIGRLMGRLAIRQAHQYTYAYMYIGEPKGSQQGPALVNGRAIQHTYTSGMLGKGLSGFNPNKTHAFFKNNMEMHEESTPTKYY